MNSQYDPNKASKAVLAVNNGEGVVLWSVGAINDEVKGDGPNAEPLGLLQGAPRGISIWEGYYVEHKDPFGTYTVPRGGFREPTEVEWAKIHKGECPWLDALFLEPSRLTMV